MTRTGRVASATAIKEGRPAALAKTGRRLAATAGTKVAAAADPASAVVAGAVSRARDGAREAVTRVVPLGKMAGAAAAEKARQGLEEARERAVPLLDSAADAVTDTVAPKVSAALKSTARRIKPKPRRRWPARVLRDPRTLVGLGVAVAAGVSVIVLRRREARWNPVTEGHPRADADGAGTVRPTSTGDPATTGDPSPADQR